VDANANAVLGYKNVGRITGKGRLVMKLGWVSCFGTVYGYPETRRAQREEGRGGKPRVQKVGQADIGRVLRPQGEKGDAEDQS
jgi:hypothetical protein